MFSALVFPAICGAAIVYFGYYTVWGTRGLLVLNDTNAHLAIRSEQLTALKSQRAHLERRIKLLEPGSVDPDLLEEVARQQLLDGVQGQIVVPRKTP
ncbi:MAG TPA: septum formation initiator family protein [Rhizomicrobium sp.]|jgi:cell division protein FtsB|nr:septum formation initiator family protein [Rhizomicrobium sp.]